MTIILDSDKEPLCIIVFGDIFHGFTFMGPFASFEAANSWCCANPQVETPWEIVPLVSANNYIQGLDAWGHMPDFG